METTHRPITKTIRRFKVNAAAKTARLMLLFLVVLSSFQPLRSQSSQGCVQWLNDFAPLSSDPVLHLRIHLYVFRTAAPGSFYENNTLANAQTLINTCNYDLSHIQLPEHSVGAPFISDSKLQLDLIFDMITDDQAYQYPYSYGPTVYNDNTSLCVYYGMVEPGGISGAHTNTSSPEHNIFFHASSYGNPHNQIDYYLNEGALLHEICHAFGLNHSYENSWLPLDNNSCCNAQLHTEDYNIDPYPGYYAAIAGCGTSTPHSNNMVSNNAACSKYLSPQQMAIIHYYLRTDYTRWLTAQSYQDLSVNHASDVVINTDETWIVDRYIKGDILVKSGHKLTINCKLALTQYARIIVEPGAQLVVEPYCSVPYRGGRITNISGQMWNGIEVGGHYGQNQALASGGYAQYQGMLRLNTGAVLEHSDNAIKNYRTDGNGNIDWYSTGGIIVANGARFLNNQRSMEFISYTGNTTGSGSVASASRFNNCLFDWTGFIAQNANPYCHVTLWDIDGVQFRGCTFDFSGNASYGLLFTQGIGSIDASYSIDKFSTTPCTFKNLFRGVNVNNMNPLNSVSINNSKFENNILDGAYFNNMENAFFGNNSVSISGQYYDASGLYLDHCKRYIAHNNSFICNTGQPLVHGTGIFARGSGAGMHQIYRNSFQHLNSGITVVGDNSGMYNNQDGLKMNCNVFNPTPNTFDIAMMFDQNSPYPGTNDYYPTVKTDQGVNNGSPVPVRNIYGASQQCYSCENQWYIEAVSVKTINHLSNSDAFTQPLPQPSYSDYGLNVINSGIPMNYAVDCPTTLPPYGGGGGGGNPSSMQQSLASINDYINNYLPAYYAATRDEITTSNEKQAAIAGKLNLFLGDTLPDSQDSVIAILGNNEGNFENADVLLSFAYMNKGDLDRATEAAAKAGEKNPLWGNYLTYVIGLKSNVSQIYYLRKTAGDMSTLFEFAADNTLETFASATALLRFFGGIEPNEPRPIPGMDASGPSAQKQNAPIKTEPSQERKIAVFPNPAQQFVNVRYEETNGPALTVKLTDALGQPVYEGRIQSASTLSIPLANLPGGVYLLSLSDEKTIVHQSRVICIK